MSEQNKDIPPLNKKALNLAIDSTCRFYRKGACFMEDIVQHSILAYLDALDKK